MSRDWKDISVLIAGVGSIGKRHTTCLQELGVKDIRACDVNETLLAQYAADYPGVKTYTSFEAGLADKPDAVFILTPPKLHIPMAIQALEAGCHVLSEKPLSDRIAGVEKLKEALDRTGKKFMVALCFRYHDGVRKAKEILDSGRIGRIVSVRAMMGEHLPDVRPDYKDLFSSKYSGAFDLMHDIDLALWFAGQPVKGLKALYGNYSDIGIEAPDLVELLIDLEGPTVATVHLDFFQKPRRRELELMGTKGFIRLEFGSWDYYRLTVADDVNEPEVITAPTVRNDMFKAEDQEFLQAIAEDKEIVCTMEEAMLSLGVVEQAQAKAEN